MTNPGALPNEYLVQIMPLLLRPPRWLEEGRFIGDTELQPGLTDAEVEVIERRHGFRFPPDLRSFLQFGFPAGLGFTDWRNDPDQIQEQLDSPVKYICEDVENAGFWMRRWGPKPESVEERAAIAREQLARVPQLIPFCGGRCLPSMPCEAGNPVLSLYGADIIYYGNDLADYLHRVFGIPRPPWARDKAKRVEFWSLFCEWDSDVAEYQWEGGWPS